MLGFVSAAGYSSMAGNLLHTDTDAINAWVDNYCRDHPLDRLVVAAESLVATLREPR
jgi:hypothetical protein